MNNLISPWTMDTIKTGKISLAMPGNVPLQQIAASDISQFVAEIVDRREAFFGKRVDIAGDELTGDQMVEKLTSITSKEFVYEGFSPDYMRETMEDMAIMFEWFDKVGYSADIQQLQKEFPNISDRRAENT